MKKTMEAFYCTEDEWVLEKEQLDKGLCWKCQKTPLPVKLCVIDYYACPACPDKRREPTDCCAGKMIKKTSKARILWRCPGCGAKSHRPETCAVATCENRGKKYEPECQKSGTFPHGNRDQ